MKAKRKRVICQERESSNALISANAGALLTSDVLLAEKTFLHHGTVNCYGHSVFVTQTSLRLAQKLHLRIDARSLIRVALLHDLYVLRRVHSSNLLRIDGGIVHQVIRTNRA